MKRFARSVAACCLLSVAPTALAQDKSAERWGTSFKESCNSPALDADMSFSVRMPPKVTEWEEYPLVAVGTDYPMVNFRNLPVAQHHGTVDWTSSICNARGQHQRMKAIGCPAELTEYPGAKSNIEELETAIFPE